MCVICAYVHICMQVSMTGYIHVWSYVHTCISLELTFASLNTLKPAVINVPVATTFNCTADKDKHKYVRMNT